MKNLNELKQEMSINDTIQFLENIQKEIQDHCEEIRPNLEILIMEYNEFIKGNNANLANDISSKDLKDKSQQYLDEIDRLRGLV